MHIGFVGLGSVVETAYLPALRELAPALTLSGFDPARALPGVRPMPSLAALLAEPLDRLVIATPSLLHLPTLEAALASTVPGILVEKPVVATLAQQQQLLALLSDERAAGRLLALDHWMARSAVQEWLHGQLGNEWHSESASLPVPPAVTLADIERLEGFLLEPSGFDAAGHPIALNFATGEPDRREFRHPDGVILDIGTHLLAMLRELLAALGGDTALTLQARDVCDRLGNPICVGDLHSAEGQACLHGAAAGVPLTLWLNKYAGPGVERKGLCLHLRGERRLELDRSGNSEWLTYHADGQSWRWQRSGALYRHCIALTLLAPWRSEWQAVTRRRLQEVGCLLTLQQSLRGPH